MCEHKHVSSHGCRSITYNWEIGNNFSVYCSYLRAQRYFKSCAALRMDGFMSVCSPVLKYCKEKPKRCKMLVAALNMLIA